MADGRVEGIYEQLKQMAVSFRLRPGDRLNEGALARELGVSRTPLREALNRLVAEKLFDFRPGAGFFCRPLDPQTIYDLYELRQMIEVGAVKAACERATDAELEALDQALTAGEAETPGLTAAQACDRDETFHLGIAQLTGNAALVLHLKRINESIRFIRWIQMSHRLRATKADHRAIMQALRARDAQKAGDAMQAHISKRMDQIVEVVREGISSIYMDGADDVSNRKAGGA